MSTMNVVLAALVIVAGTATPAFAQVDGRALSADQAAVTARAPQGPPALELAPPPPFPGGSTEAPPPAPRHRLLPWLWVAVGGLVVVGVVAAVASSRAPQPQAGNFASFVFP